MDTTSPGVPRLRSDVTAVRLDAELLVMDPGTGVLLRLSASDDRAATGPDGPSPAPDHLRQLGLTVGSTPLDRRSLISAAATLGVTTVLLPPAAEAASVSFTSATGAVDQSLDASIGGDPTHRVADVALRADGRMLVVGTFTQVGSTTLEDVALLEPNGAVVTGFEAYSAYRGFTSAGAFAALDTGDALIVGASYSSLSVADADPNVVDLGGPIFSVTADGSPSALLSSGTDNPSDDVLALAEDGAGRILVGGLFENIAFEPIPALARLEANGAVDTSFAPFDANTESFSRIAAIAVLPDGRIAIGGAFTSVGGVSRPGTAILAANGDLAAGLEATLDGNVNALAIDRSGGILVGGEFYEVDGGSRIGLARYHGNGVLDDGFQATIDFGSVQSIAVQPDGRILVGGDLHAGDPTTFVPDSRIHNLVRLEENGAVDRSLPDLGLDGAVTTVKVADNGAIIIGGEFTEVDGVTRRYVARVV